MQPVHVAPRGGEWPRWYVRRPDLGYSGRAKRITARARRAVSMFVRPLPGRRGNAMRSRPERWDIEVDRVGRRKLLWAGLTTGLGVVTLGGTALIGGRPPELERRAFLTQEGW